MRKKGGTRHGNANRASGGAGTPEPGAAIAFGLAPKVIASRITEATDGAHTLGSPLFLDDAGDGSLGFG